MEFPKQSRLTVHSRPSSWGTAADDSMSPSDTGSPSCYTLESTMTGDLLSAISRTGTIPLGLAHSPVSPESQSSSLNRLAWKPLFAGNSEGKAKEHAIPPLPSFDKLPSFNRQQRQPIEFPPGIEINNATYQVHIETHSHHHLHYSSSMKSEYPEIVDKTPSDVGPVPSLPYSNRAHQQSRTDLRLPLDGDKPLHTDIIPGKTQPPQIPDSPNPESPAPESYYKAGSAYTTGSGTKVTILPAASANIPLAQDSPAFSFELSPQLKPKGNDSNIFNNASSSSNRRSDVSSISSMSSSGSSVSSIDADYDVYNNDNHNQKMSNNTASSLQHAKTAAHTATATSTAGPSNTGFSFTPNTTTAPLRSASRSAVKGPPAPIAIKSPPQDLGSEWRPPPQTPTRSLSLSQRPIAHPPMPTTLRSAVSPPVRSEVSNSPAWSSPSQVVSPPTQYSQVPPSHSRSDSTSSTTRLMSGHNRTRSFSAGNKPSPFKLNPGNQQYPAPPPSATKSTFSLRLPTSKFSDDGDGSGGKKKKGSSHAKNQWRVHFTTPLTLTLLFLCGLISAALHHVYYSQLNGTSPGVFQRWHTSGGIAIAIFTIALWTACAAICYKQRVWTTLCQKDMRITDIDTLWGLLQDPSLFLVRETWKKSRVAMGLGIIVWVLPLTTIFVPGSLTVLPATHESRQSCLAPSFNPPNSEQAKLLAAEPFVTILKNKPKKVNTMTTLRAGTPILTNIIKRLATISAFSAGVVDYPLPEACSGQGNCSYTLSFTAPGYKCDVVSTEEAQKNGPWGGVSGFNERVFTRNSSRTNFYSALADNRTTTSNGNFSTSSLGGTGTFWVGFMALKPDALAGNPSLLLDPTKARDDQYHREVFKCVDYLTQYDNVKFSYVNSKMQISLPNTPDRGIRYVAPVDYARITVDRIFNELDSVIFNRVAHDYTFSVINGDTFIRDGKVLRQGQGEGTHIMDDAVTFGQSEPTGDGIKERFTLPSIDLRERVQQLHRNVTLSLLAEPTFKATYYVPVQCTVSQIGTVYKYEARPLLIAYGIACFLTCITMAVGIISLYSNGFVADFTFSRILCTTRNPTLDEICRGESCLGSATESVGRRRLRFGEVWVKNKGKQAWSTEPIMAKAKGGLGIVQEEEDGDLEDGAGVKSIRVGHAAFGVASEVVALRKGKEYA